MSPAKSYEKAQPSLLEVGEGWQEEGDCPVQSLLFAHLTSYGEGLAKAHTIGQATCTEDAIERLGLASLPISPP